MKLVKRARVRRSAQSKEIREAVASIIDGVRERGDEAVLEYSRRFDNSERTVFRVESAEAQSALESLSAEERAAITMAAGHIKSFAAAQRSSLHEINSFSPMAGVTLGQRIVPVDSVCCYVPGGAYPLLSTALMLIIPAKIAGVPRIAACSPVMKGTAAINPKTLGAMVLAGADEIYAVGGVQAVAAFAYGTEQIKNAALIVGPGNAYVAEAKRQCYGQAGIDFIAGPSEVLVIADETASPEIIAADMLAQCEHDPLAQAVLVTTSENIAAKTLFEIKKQLETLPTAAVAEKSWADYGEIYLAADMSEAVDFANERASEHLELQTAVNDALVPQLRNYGALFIGGNAAEVFGDYAAGTNHTLPTQRAARWTGGVWVGTFLKTLTFQNLTAQAAAVLAPAVSVLARAEGLAAHGFAAERRVPHDAGQKA
ncbi:MAG: histidinol dehydrogenase [Spirochaetaceae bacterium]|jgi:histidinol dehydrogenase|nr:histidinol dehydrogenase [Spirochaetaceae bacterium]